MSALPGEAIMRDSNQAPATPHLTIAPKAKPESLVIKPAKSLSEREKIDFVTTESEIIVNALNGLDPKAEAEKRQQVRARLVGGLLSKLSMAEVPPPESEAETGFVKEVKKAEEADSDLSFMNLYNLTGDHPLIRPIDTAFDQVDAHAQADAKTLMRGAMILVRNVVKQ